jgi:hypothetical protein
MTLRLRNSQEVKVYADDFGARRCLQRSVAMGAIRLIAHLQRRMKIVRRRLRTIIQHRSLRVCLGPVINLSPIITVTSPMRGLAGTTLP